MYSWVDLFATTVVRGLSYNCTVIFVYLLSDPNQGGHVFASVYLFGSKITQKVRNVLF